MSRELDAKVAEMVLGIQLPEVRADDFSFNNRPDFYTTELYADYEVLKHVRDKWDNRAHQAKFDIALVNIWSDRWQAGRHTTLLGCVLDLHCLYEPGDYSKAALKALGEDIGG